MVIHRFCAFVVDFCAVVWLNALARGRLLLEIMGGHDMHRAFLLFHFAAVHFFGGNAVGHESKVE